MEILQRLKKKVGRPSKYDPKYCQEIIDFFDIDFFEERVVEKKEELFRDGSSKSIFEKTLQVANPLRFISQFARKIGISRSEINLWAEKHPEFSEALKEAKELQREHLITCGLKGLFNPSFAIFSAKNMIGWRDEQYLKGDGDKGEIVIRVEHTKIGDNENNLQAPRFAIPDIQ